MDSLLPDGGIMVSIARLDGWNKSVALCVVLCMRYVGYKRGLEADIAFQKMEEFRDLNRIQFSPILLRRDRERYGKASFSRTIIEYRRPG